MDLDINLYENIGMQTMMARMEFGGLVVARYGRAFDALHYARKKREIESTSYAIGEPILLSMGDIEMLFVPDNEKTQELFENNVPEGGGWLPPVSIEKQGVVSDDAFQRALLFSGADAYEEPQWELDGYYGMDRRIIKPRLNALARKGLGNIAFYWGNEETIYPDPAIRQGMEYNL